MKALCNNCYCSNVECNIIGRLTICVTCEPNPPKKEKITLKYPTQDRHKERWDVST